MLLPTLTSRRLRLNVSQGTRPFMSGEILGQTRYFDKYGGAQYDDDDDDDDADTKTIKVVVPTHSFWHDLESLFWVLFWLCMCRAGPALQRAELWKDDDDEGKNEPKEEYRKLFGNAGNSQLSSNKATIIKDEDQFEDAVMKIHRWCWQLRDLLRQFSVILRSGYRSQNFSVNETYQAFMAALEAAEQRLLAKPKKLLSEQQAAYDAEAERRAADNKDWKLPSRTLPEPAALLDVDEKPPTPEPPVKKLAALVLEPRSERLDLPGTESKHYTTDLQRQKNSQSSKQPQTLHAQQPAKNLPSSHAQAATVPSTTKALTAKGSSKKAQAATATPATQSTGMLTRAMKRAASAASGSSTVLTRSTRVPASSEEATTKSGPGRGVTCSREESGEVDADTTAGGHRKKGKERVGAK